MVLGVANQGQDRNIFCLFCARNKLKQEMEPKGGPVTGSQITSNTQGGGGCGIKYSPSLYSCMHVGKSLSQY